MKYIFIINPFAGPRNAEEFIRSEVTKALANTTQEYEIEFYVTNAPGDATDFVAKYADEHPNLDVCFIACGGDGTVFEVTNGVVGRDNAYMCVYPCGSGNDYVKYYGGREPFFDILGIFEGSVREVDVMKVGDKFSINICNFGFESAVANCISTVKRLPVIGGKNAYYTGIAKAIFTSMKNKCKVYADGELLNPDGKILLCSLGNGAYVGGSFNCSPNSDNTDGLMEVCLVKPVTLPRFVSLIPYYEQGTHLESDKFKDILVYRRAKSVRVQAHDGFKICLDGEIEKCAEATVENIQGGVHFIVPRNAKITPAKNAPEKEPVTV